MKAVSPFGLSEAFSAGILTCLNIFTSPFLFQDQITLASCQTGEEKANVCWLKNLFRENIDWNYIGGSAWLGSQDPLFLRAGGVGTIHAISNLPHGHSSSHPTDLFGHFSKNWFSSFFTATKETVGAFFLGTQGLNLASFGFRSPFQSQWKFVSPNWGVQIVYQLHNPFSCSKFVSFNKLVCLNSFPSFTVFYVDHRPEHITWLRRSLIKFWICGAQYWLRW